MLYYCSTEVNECAANPCENGGSCVSDHGRYFCLCRGGFTGVHCERSKRACHVSHIITSSHHMEKTEAGLKGLYIREITLK